MEERQAGVYKDRSVGRRMAFFSEASCSADSKIPDEDKVLYLVIDGCDQAPAANNSKARQVVTSFFCFVLTSRR